METLSVCSNSKKFGDIKNIRFTYSDMLPAGIQPFSNVAKINYLIPAGYQEFKGKDLSGNVVIQTDMTESGTASMTAININMTIGNTLDEIIEWYEQFRGRNLIVEVRLDNPSGEEVLTQNPMQMSMKYTVPEGIENAVVMTLSFALMVQATDIFSGNMPATLIASITVTCGTIVSNTKVNFLPAGTLVKEDLQISLSRISSVAMIRDWKDAVTGTDDFTGVENGNYTLYARKKADTNIYDSMPVTVACKYCKIKRLQITKLDAIKKPTNLVGFDPTTNSNA